MREQYNQPDGEIYLTRNGEPPLRFTGTVLGTGSTRNHNSTRWTNCAIWRTKAGHYVALLECQTQWQGERDRAQATSGTASEVCEWLKRDDGEYGEAGQAALEAASRVDAGINASWVRQIA